MNYTQIKAAYITGNQSLRQLAQQHQISRSTLSALARREDWAAQREDYRRRVQQAIAQQGLRQELESAQAIGQAAQILINWLAVLAADQRQWYDQQEQRGFAAADLQQIRELIGALKELKAMTQDEQTGDSARIQVVFSAETAACAG